MFSKVSHLEGLVVEDEILFSTPFDYFFPEAARSERCLLPTAETTREILKHLADCMGDPGDPADPMAADFDSAIPAIFTYFGQFIDHDITARTDRDSSVTSLGQGDSVSPVNPDEIVGKLRNGRRPTLDMDSVFGDGPALANGAKTQSQVLYDGELKLHVHDVAGRFDLPRSKKINAKGELSYPAIIADMRNDENVIVSQLQTAFIKFYNAIHDAVPGNKEEKYIHARQLASWAYQYVVIHDYLKHVCDANVVQDTLLNGPRFIGAAVGRAGSFMPLEFSVAAFRFGHSMIRPFYQLNDISGNVEVMNLLGTGEKPENFSPVDPACPDAKQLIPEWIIDWNKFVGDAAQKARKIDKKIARGLFSLDRVGPVLKHLARSNLFRSYSLSIPTGQAMCDAFGIFPLKPNDILDCEDSVLKESWVDHRTPLWYYVLREAAVQQNGDRLGELGSRMVSETIINLIKQDQNSYLNNCCHPAVEKDAAGNVTGIRVAEGENGLIATLQDILVFAGVLDPVE